ncbi:MAG: cytochrome c biogenesis protein CcsA [Muribaculaceae bacterium]|nr:cytochrome c biogenesis protein CcsA [Muribaculaceae bacterium]
MKHQPFTILLHIALAVMLVGAIVTHFFGIQGTLTLTEGAEPVARFEKSSGPGRGEFPFSVSLDKVEIIYYPATATPMDFRSVVDIDGRKIAVAMNKVGECRGWRFYQSGIGPGYSVFSISHDPFGTGITYVGYAMLGIGMLGFFFQKKTAWRALLRKYRKGLAVMALLLAVVPAHAATAERLPAMQRPLAANFGRVLVYWHDRVCPMQTLARDVAASLYGSCTYQGLTSEQILSGWLFYYDQWRGDYIQTHPELMSVPAFPATKAEKKAAEKLALVQWLGTGEIFKIYPYHTVEGRMEWLSLTGWRPSSMELDQWVFMQAAMPTIKDLLMRGKNVQANEELEKLKEGQRRYAVGAALPSEAKIDAERIYNAAARPAIAGIFAIVLGLSSLILSLFPIGSKRWMRAGAFVAAIALCLYAASIMGLLWWISGHLPLSNGPETMMFMALASFAGACLCGNLTLRGGLMTVGAMALFVTAMGGSAPQIGTMMPVLSSPLLSVHVMVVMIAYAMFMLMAILSAVALLSRTPERSRQLGSLNRIMLTPAVCLLGVGIFIGAVWANQTWGRYWGWDPKETCALVMWLVYALPAHWGSRRLSAFRKDRVLHAYLLCAILTVIFTYFGANYLLGGLHSYA